MTVDESRKAGGFGESLPGESPSNGLKPRAGLARMRGQQGSVASRRFGGKSSECQPGMERSQVLRLSG